MEQISRGQGWPTLQTAASASSIHHVKITQAPKPEDWMQVRDVFIDLYVDQGKKLEDVREILAQHFGFHAPLKSYKRKINRWSAFKNYKAADKRALVQCNSSTSSPAVTTTTQLRGRPVKWNRIERYRRSSNLYIGGSDVTKHRSGSLRPLRPATSLLTSSRMTMSLDEQALFQTKLYLDWNAASWKTLGDFDRQTYGDQPGGRHFSPGEETARLPFTKSFHDGCHLLASGRNDEAFARLNTGCGYVKEYLPQRSYLILIQIMRLFSYQIWARFPDLRRHLLKYFRLMASQTLEKNHPFRDLLETWDATETLTSGIQRVLALIAEEYGPNGGLPHHDWVWIQDEVAFWYYQLSNFGEALTIARGLADEDSVPASVSNKALGLMGQCYLQQRRFQDAAAVLFRVVEVCEGPRNDGDAAMNISLFSTLFDIGVLFETMNDPAQSFQYYCRAMEEAAKIWGRQYFVVTDMYTYLENMLIRQGLHDELARLKETYCTEQ